jgi:large conductance mechanosensitive channel protein
MAARSSRRRHNAPHHRAHAVTIGSNVRLEPPQSDRGQQNGLPSIVEVAQEINPASGFVNFLREQAVVGLAVGFIIGTQAQGLVKQLVASFIDPLFTLFFGQQITSKTFAITFHDRTATFAWGTFIYAFINFVFVLLAIYLVIKFFNLDKLDKPKDKKKK